MKEIVGNLWDYRTPDYVKCITTNGVVRKDGACVMGRGCAREAVVRDPQIQYRLGSHILRNGNVPCWLSTGIVSFPVKHAWWEEADLKLIEESARWLAKEADYLRQKWFVLPRPGCGNGRLKWEDVRPVLAHILPDNVLVISKPNEDDTTPKADRSLQIPYCSE